MQYDIIESTDNKRTFITRRNKTGINTVFGKPRHKSFKEPRFLFVVTGNGKTHIKNSNGTVDVECNNQRKVTHLCAIAWELLIWRIKLFLSSQMILMILYLLSCLATMKN